MKLLQRIQQALLVASIALAATSAQASTAINMSFDGLASPGATAAAYGVQFQHSYGTHFVVPGASYLPGYTQGDLLAYYALTGQSETLSLTGATPATFSLQSLDLSGVLGFGPSDALSINIVGTRSNGSLVFASQPFSVIGGAVSTYGSSFFTGFTGLTSVSFSGTAGNYARYVGLDNIAITITPVPEPETLALLIGGLALMGVVLRRRKAA
jgi:hypothetical protein